MDDLMYHKGLKAGVAGNWELVEDAAQCDAETAAALLQILDEKMPSELKYRIALYHYSHHGDNYPVIRRCLRENKKHRAENWRDQLPEAVRANKVFTVYRGGSESINKAKYKMSWSLSRDVAEWFASRNVLFGYPDQHIYRATIPADKVIAYINDRSEFEIVQYQNVRNIVELPCEGVSEEYKAIEKITQESFSMETVQKQREAKLEYVNRKLKESQE